MDVRPLVLVVEDEDAISGFIAAVLSANGYRTVRAGTGGEALALAASHTPDLILLDLGLPDIDGVDVLRRVRAWTKTPVVVVSARGHEREKVEALDLGADDYIVKPFGTSELLARVRTALRHSPQVMGARPLERAAVGALEIDYDRRVVLLSGEKLHLTPIEYRLLALLFKNAGRVLTYDFMIGEVWGPRAADAHTLRVNMANLRRKIEENPGEPKYILTEMGVGYRMVEETDK